MKKMLKPLAFLVATALAGTALGYSIGNSFFVFNGTWYTGSNPYVQPAGYADGAQLGEITELELGAEVMDWDEYNAATWLPELQYCFDIETAEEIWHNDIQIPYLQWEGGNANKFMSESAGQADLSELDVGPHTISLLIYKLAEDNQTSLYDSNNGDNYTASFTLIKKIGVPEAVTGLVYDGTEQTGVAAGTGYTLSDSSATAAGVYTATATLDPYYQWEDGTTDPKAIEWSIAAMPTVTLEPTGTNIFYNEWVGIEATASGFTDDENVTWAWYVYNRLDSTQTGNHFDLNPLEYGPGEFEVTAKATYGDEEAEASVIITIKAPIVTLDPGATEVYVGDDLTIWADATSFVNPVLEWDGPGMVDEYSSDMFNVDTSVPGTFVISITATEDSDYFFSDSASVTITVSQRPEPYFVNVDVKGGMDCGEVLPSPTEAYPGDLVNLEVYPARGWKLGHITVNGTPIDGTQFTMAPHGADVVVTFVKDVGFEKITSLDELTDGEYVITGVKGAEEFAMLAEVSTTSTNYILRRTEAVTIEGDAVTDVTEDIIWTLAQDADSGNWTIYNSAVGYVFWTSENSANAGPTATAESYWTISLNSDGEGTFAGVNAENPARNLRYNTNSGQERFAAYQPSADTGLLTGSGLNLYKAPFVPPTKAVTFILNYEGADNPFYTLECVVGGPYAADGFVSPMRENYDFRGWYTDPDDGEGERIRGHFIVEDDEPLTLYAHWRAVRQTVTFDANDGGAGAVVAKPTASYLLGDFYAGGAFSMSKTVWAGHKFLGWYDDPIDGERVKAGDIVTPEKTRTLYAHWRQLRQTVTFDGNGEGAVVKKLTVKYDVGGEYSGAAFSMSAASRAGYDFRGWYDAPKGGTRVKAGDAVTTDSSRTLYAIWKKATPAAIIGFSVSPRIAAPAARGTSSASVECTLSFETVAGSSYEVLWTPSLTGDWEVLTSLTATATGVTAVTVEVPADSPTGFFRLVEVFDD